MADVTFYYPSMTWIIVAGVVGALIGALLLKNIVPTLFLALLGAGGAYFVRDEMLPSHVEQWLAGQRPYAILFADFPKDKDRFISEYVSAYKSGGEVGVAQKQQEMKIIMGLHHVPHYIERAHTDTIHQYIVAHAWLISTLFKKDHNLCNAYLKDSQYFPNVWSTAGGKIFLGAVRYYPQMIVEGTDSPEQVAQGDQARAVLLSAQILQALAPAQSGSFSRPAGVDLCDAEYREYYLLSQMPPKDGALVLKFLMGENHLKQAPAQNFLQKILPW